MVALSLALHASVLDAKASTGSSQRQDGEDTGDKEYRAEAPSRPRDMPLAALPEAPSRELSAPRPLAREAIDRLLSQVVSPDEVIRSRAVRSLLEAKSDWTSGLSRQIDKLAEKNSRKAMKGLLSKMRDRVRARSKKETGSHGETPDYLSVALEAPDPQSDTWRDLVHLLSINRMLAAIATTASTRQIIRVYVRFGDVIRIDCQRQLESLGELAVAALIEAKQHPAPNIAAWAKKRLRLQNRLTPHDAVRTKDDQALASILVALGRTRDPDSAELLISFAGTERAQIRLAARQGISLLGEVAAWQLKDAFLNTTGKKPPRDWTWKRSARELFTEFDRLRLARAYAAYEKGNQAKASGDLGKMREAYDQVLALNPTFERGDKMAVGYQSFAEAVLETDRSAAILALRRAQRIATSTSTKQKLEGRLKLLEAQELSRTGFVDRGLLEQAVSLDPSGRDAANALLRSPDSVASWGENTRYLLASAISSLSLFGVSWILFSTWKRRRKNQLASKSEKNGSAALR